MRQPTVYERTKAAVRQQPAPADEGGSLNCKAYGCPCRGVIDLGGGFHCTLHAYASPDKWPQLTSSIREHEWLLSFIGEMQDHHQRGKTTKELGALAATFWEVDPSMAPTPDEQKHWNWYLWRVREELAFRVGQRKDKPAPRVPQVQDPKVWAAAKVAA